MYAWWRAARREVAAWLRCAVNVRTGMEEWHGESGDGRGCRREPRESGEGWWGGVRGGSGGEDMVGSCGGVGRNQGADTLQGAGEACQETRREGMRLVN
jgi:hypothetical protein